MDGQPARGAVQCLNCEATVAAGDAFCARCGQKADTRRLSLADIGHALVHVLTHADHSVLRLVRDLAIRPGRVSREYVAGRRRKYFNPFTFVIVVVGVASLLMTTTRFLDFGHGVAANPVSRFLQDNVNLVILVQLPLLAFFCGLFFRRERLHFAEHLVLASYASGFRSIFFTLVVLPAWAILGTPYQPTVAVYLALWLAYFAVACAQFYEGPRAWLWVKGLLVGLAAQAVTTAAIFAMINAWFRYFR